MGKLVSTVLRGPGDREVCPATRPLEQVFSKTRHQRCIVHKTANILNTVPTSFHHQVKHDLHEIWTAPSSTASRPSNIRPDDDAVDGSFPRHCDVPGERCR